MGCLIMERDMFMDLANFQDEKIEHSIVVNKVELPFNIGNYMEAYKLRNVRLYLRMKNIFSIEDEEEDDLPTYLQAYKKPDAPETQSNTALLIGTSEERKKIAEEHDEYCLTLNADIAKEEEQQHKKIVHDARMSRVNPEPLTEYVTVKVRHPLLGVVSRKFQVHSLMSSVYDWAGSLKPDPVNFTLNDPFGVVLLPSMEVADRCTLTMMEFTDGTPSLCQSDDEINFLGFGEALNSNSSSLFPKLAQDYTETQLLPDIRYVLLLFIL